MSVTVPEAPQFCGVPQPPDQPEEGAVAVQNAASPLARVKAAVACLGGGSRSSSSSKQPADASSGTRSRPTILDYHSAYRSGAITPVDVAEAIIGFLEREEGAAHWLCEWHPEHLRAQVGGWVGGWTGGWVGGWC